MKRLILLFASIIFITSQAQSELVFDYQRLDINYTAVIHKYNNVFFSGNSNIITRYNKALQKWNHIKVGKKDIDIITIKDSDQSLYGIFKHQYIFKLDINGTPLQIENISDTSTKFLDVQYHLGKYYILCRDKLIELDSGFSFVRDIELPEEIEVLELTVFDEAMIIGTTNGKLLVFEGQVNSSPDIIDLNSMQLCEPDARVHKFIESDNELYLIIGSKIYSSGDLESFRPHETNNLNYNVNHGKVFTFSVGGNELNQCSFHVYENQEPVLVNRGKLDRYVEQINVLNFYFVDYNIIYAVGSNNLILRSTDRGGTWKVISFLKPYYKSSWISDETGFIYADDGIFIKTTNGGITWQPQLNTWVSLKKFNRKTTCNFDQDGRCVMFRGYVQGSDPHAVISKDSCNTFEYKRINEISSYGFVDLQAPIVRTEDEYKLFYPGRHGQMTYTLIYTLDLELNYKNKELLDAIHIFDIKSYKDGWLALAKDFKYTDLYSPDTNVYHVMYSDYPGVEWDTLLTVNLMDTIARNINIFGDQVFLNGHVFNPLPDTSRYVLYLLDPEYSTYKSIRVDYESTYNKVFKTGNYYVTGGNNCLLYCEDIENNPEHWEKTTVEGYNIFYLMGKGNNSMYAYTYDGHYLKFTFQKETSVEDISVEKVKMYSYPPYPQPANYSVKFEIFWDSRYNLENAAIAVHDYMGRVVSRPGEISIDKLNNYQGYLNWNCSKTSNGVYFITINNAGTVKTVPVVVDR